MKILVICQYYAPEPFRISDICEELVRRGHDVTVVTGVPNYPMGKIYDGYQRGQKRDEKINGVTVHRCFTIARKHGAIYRFLNYYSYVFPSVWYTKKLPGDFDVVFINQLSPVMMASAGLAYKRKYGVPVIMYCLDLWPESLLAGGVGKGSLIYNAFHKISKRIYQQSDKIYITSNSFADYFEKEFGITATQYLPQYAESIFTPEQCRKEPNNCLDLMFAGNIGVAQSVETILQAARLTVNIPNLHWHIVGDGSKLDDLKFMAHGIENVFFHGRQPLEKMSQYYAMADVMLVTLQKNEALSLTLPGKMQTYMAAGKPIIGAADGEVPLVIEKSGCGFCAPAEDPNGLAEAVLKFLNVSDRVRLGENARIYYEQHFSREEFMDKLEDVLVNHELVLDI